MVVAEVVKTFDDSWCGSKLSTSSATQKQNLDEPLLGRQSGLDQENEKEQT